MAGSGFRSGEDLKSKAPGYHGQAQFQLTAPAFEQKSLNVYLTFEEALKLSLSLQSALHEINGKDRATSRGKALGLLLSIKRDRNQIAVITRAIPSNRSAAGLKLSDDAVS